MHHTATSPYTRRNVLCHTLHSYCVEPTTWLEGLTSPHLSLLAGTHPRPHAPPTHHMTDDVSEAKQINRSTSATLVHTSSCILSLTILRSPRIMRRASPLGSSTLTACSTSLHVAPSANRWACVEPSGWTTGTMGDSCGLVSTLGSVHDRSAYLLLGGLFALRTRRQIISTQSLANHSTRGHRWMVISLYVSAHTHAPPHVRPPTQHVCS